VPGIAAQLYCKFPLSPACLCGSVSPMKRFVMILGLFLVILALVAFLHPSFDYHKREEVAKIGRLTATFDKPERATVPPAVAAALLIVGVVLLVLSPKLGQ